LSEADGFDGELEGENSKEEGTGTEDFIVADFDKVDEIEEFVGIIFVKTWLLCG
jgi:hypothetical protein